MTFATFLTLATFATAQTESSALIVSDIFKDDLQWRAIEACPRIRDIRTTGGTGSSVVVAIKDNAIWALTVNHVVSGAVRIDAEFFVRASYPAAEHTLHDVQVMERSATADLALLRIPFAKKTMPPLSAEHLALVGIGGVAPVERMVPPPALPLAKPGQRPKKFPFDALAVGCDEGFSARCLLDKVEAKRFIRRTNGNAIFWETYLMSRHGRSGGALLDAQGHVIGLCAGNQNYKGYYVHTDEIHAWLKSAGYEWLWRDDKR